MTAQWSSIDTCSTEKRTRAYLEKSTEIAGRVPRRLVNTHHHGDHTNGNCLLPFATVIGHDHCRDEVLETGDRAARRALRARRVGRPRRLRPPFVTFDHRLDVYVDDLEVELIHLTAAAHTTNDIVAWIPEHRVLFSGDLVFNGGTPFVVMGSVAGSLEALALADRARPGGHRARPWRPGGADIVDACGEYLRWSKTAPRRPWLPG